MAARPRHGRESGPGSAPYAACPAPPAVPVPTRCGAKGAARRLRVARPGTVLSAGSSWPWGPPARHRLLAHQRRRPTQSRCSLIAAVGHRDPEYLRKFFLGLDDFFRLPQPVLQARHFALQLLFLHDEGVLPFRTTPLRQTCGRTATVMPTPIGQMQRIQPFAAQKRGRPLLPACRRRPPRRSVL